jgi:uncharacterized protein (TIGR03118 family)
MNQKIAPFLAPCLMSAIAFSILPGTARGSIYSQNNLVSDITGEAAVTDPNLKNPWGISFSATSPFWVSDNAANVATIYSSGGVPNALVVSVPGGPTGQVFNSAGAGNFLDGGMPASFIFATQGGGIYAWNSGHGTTAQLLATTNGASFTGLALDNNGSRNCIYAADDAGSGGIVVFNSSFAQTTLAGIFTDPNLPAGLILAHWAPAP